LRVVIVCSKVQVSTTYDPTDGTTADGMPYYNLVHAGGLAPGATTALRRLNFRYQRAARRYQTRVERNTPPPGPGAAPSALAFGQVRVGRSSLVFIDLSNTGNVDLPVVVIQVSGTGFEVFPPTGFDIPA
jgi:hypothetical protein